MLEVSFELFEVLITDCSGGDRGFIVADVKNFRGMVRRPGGVRAIGGGGVERGGAGGGGAATANPRAVAAARGAA